MSTAPQIRVDPDAGSYRGYQQNQRYSHDLGLIVLPVASRASKHRVIRLHGGYATRHVTWASSRVGAPPMIPTATDTQGDTLLSTTVMPSLPVPDMANNAYSWTVAGEYTYVQDTPRVAGTNAFPAGQTPYLVLPQMQIGNAAIQGAARSANTALTIDDMTEAAGDAMSRQADGSIAWPFTILPAWLSSTHIIGG